MLSAKRLCVNVQPARGDHGVRTGQPHDRKVSVTVVKALMQNGLMVTQNETIDADTAELIIEEFGHKACARFGR